MESEFLDVIDVNNNIIGQASEAEVHERNLLHRAVAVLLETADGAYLIPTFSSRKVTAGQLLHSAVGHVFAHETYLAAAARELKRQIGLVAPRHSFHLLGSYILNTNSESHRESLRFEIFRVRYNVSLGPIIFNEEPTDELWLDTEELKEIYLNEPDRLSPSLRFTLQKFFDMN